MAVHNVPVVVLRLPQVLFQNSPVPTLIVHAQHLLVLRVLEVRRQLRVRLDALEQVRAEDLADLAHGRRRTTAARGPPAPS